MKTEGKGRWVPCLVQDAEGILRPCCGHQREASGRPVPGCPGERKEQMPNIVKNKIVAEGIVDLPIFWTETSGLDVGIKQLNFNSLIPEPEDLIDVPSGAEEKSFLWLIKKALESESIGKFIRDCFNISKLEIAKAIFGVTDEEPGSAECHILNLIRTGEPSWYYWRRKHWGTKWNAFDTEIIDSNTIVFGTAWNPVPKVVDAMQSKFKIPRIEYSWVSENYTENGRLIFTDNQNLALKEALPVNEKGVPLLFEELFGYSIFSDIPY